MRRPSAQNGTGVLEHGVYTLEAVVSSVEGGGRRLGGRELALKTPSRGRGHMQMYYQS